jgi:phosphoadenosine phosphosulfate reductase
MQKFIDELNQELESKSVNEVLDFVLNKLDKKISFATSFGAEDLVLLDLISKVAPKSTIFTLDTGRLPYETYELLDLVKLKYSDTKVDIYFPNNQNIESMVNENGINLFYESIENRKLCCFNRKIEPLKRALRDVDGWVTGLRREQSVTRESMRLVEWDSTFEILKFNPLINFTEKDVWDYIKSNKVPYNKLHDKNYPSIGCAPCTRAIKEGEDIRAGRWWWESPEHKECGLHKR